MGTDKSGFRAHIRGWNVGIEVVLQATEDGTGPDQDTITVYLTGGSNGHGSSRILAHVQERQHGKPEETFRPFQG